MSVSRSVAEGYAAFLAALERGEQSRRRGILRRACWRVAGITAAAVAILLLVNLAVPALGRTAGVFLLLVLVAALAMVGRAAFVARRPVDPRAAALAVEERDPTLGREALTAIDLWALRDDSREGYSPELLMAAVEDRARRLAAIDFASYFKRPTARVWPALAAGGFVCALAALFISPHSAVRLLGNSALFRTGIVVTPGDVRVLAGDSLVIRAEVFGPPGDDPVWVEFGEGERHAMVAEGSGSRRFTHTVPRVLREFTYRATGGDITSPSYHVTLTDRPRVMGIDLVIHPPAYTREEPRRIEHSDGHIAALRGSRIEIVTSANVPLSQASILVDGANDDAGAGTMKIDGEGRTATGELTVTRSGSYRMELLSREGHPSIPEEPRAIVALNDEAPFVRFVRPEPQVTLGPDLGLALTVSAVDDYGLGPLVLHYRVSQGDTDENIPEEKTVLARGGDRGAGGREIELDHAWDLASLDLGPGDVLSYWVSVTDNDAVSGPKDGRTPVYQARFPGLEEVYAQVTGESEAQRKSLEEVAEEERELKNRMEELTRETARKQELSWEDREDLARSLERQRELQAKVGEIVQSLEESARTADQHDLLSQEILQRMAELQELMREVATPDLLQAMEQLQKAMSQVSPEELAQAMKQLSLNQEQFLQRLERTIELLKRFEMEQRLEEMVARADELLERQDRILEELDDESKKDAESMGDLATREERVSADTEKLQEEAEALAQELQKQDAEAASALDEATTGLESEAVKQALNEASQQMSMGNKSKAQARGSQARGGQKNFRDRLAMAQNQFTESLRQEVMAELQRASREVLALSLDQEDLADQMEGPVADRDAARGLAADQQDLLGGLRQVTDRLMKLGEKSLFVTPAMGKSLGNSLARMNEAVGDLSEGRAGVANERAKSAIVSMNETVIELRKAQENASSCQSGTGMSQMMETLSAMSCQQAGVNEGTQALQDQLGSQPGGMPSDQTRSEMARLAAEQRSISETLRQALEEGNGNGGQNGTLGRLDQALDDMNKTLEDLSSGRLTPETTQRQERILSRLLDAQRSARRRDFEDRRISRPGQIAETPVSPAALPEGLTRTPTSMREDLLRSASERYPPEYEALIREYFRALWNEESP